MECGAGHRLNDPLITRTQRRGQPQLIGMEIPSGEHAARQHQFRETGIEHFGRANANRRVTLATIAIAPEVLHGRDVHYVDDRELFHDL